MRATIGYGMPKGVMKTKGVARAAASYRAARRNLAREQRANFYRPNRKANKRK
jgi:hypothetical protein